ncbi:cupredoxin domain-containing protein [Luedemannella helvata]|uniref:EfeO-type cupredoxin-like domain-containing protein n=1 Tax=Luedemannella helvata TaxID=349315 RepID=A0ABP4X379_9ACTN
MRTTILALSVAALLSLSGCAIWGSEGGPGGSGMKKPVLQQGAGATADDAVDVVAGDDGVQRATITLTDGLRFSPSTVRARPGTVELTFVNSGGTAHDIAVRDAGATADTGNLNGGQQGTVRVTVTAPGRYPFPCLYHASSGMVGTLVIG